MQKRGARDPGQQAFELERGSDAVGVFLSDDFALFGDAHFPGERAFGQRFEEYVRGTGSAAYGASAAVKEREARIMFFCDGGEFAFGLMQTPLAGENASVLIAVA